MRSRPHLHPATESEGFYHPEDWPGGAICGICERPLEEGEAIHQAPFEDPDCPPGTHHIVLACADCTFQALQS